VENLVRLCQADLMIPHSPFADLAAANTAGRDVMRVGQRRGPWRDLRDAG
jgi:hypothetical protein